MSENTPFLVAVLALALISTAIATPVMRLALREPVPPILWIAAGAALVAGILTILGITGLTLTAITFFLLGLTAYVVREQGTDRM